MASSVSGFSCPFSHQAAPQFGANVSGQAVKTALNRLGCQEVRQKGSHLIMQTAAGQTLPPIPMHGSQDLSPGVLRSLAQALQLSKQQFEQFIRHPKGFKGELSLPSVVLG